MNEPSGWIFLGLRFGLALSLYAFLAVTIVIVWKEMQQQAKLSIQKTIPPIQLVNKNDDGNVQQISLSTILIGRDPMCEYSITNETVSSKHARIFFDKGQWWVEDLDSSNGTFLNEHPVEIKTVLTSGDQLRFGQVEIKISI
jgi:pSer/pThr/pTyr-binding forkhead associated (FHA) protein